MALFKKREKWYIDYYYQGRRIRECIGTSKRRAQKALDARKGEIVQGRFKLQEVRPSPLFPDAVSAFLRWAQDNRRSWTRDQHLVKSLLTFFQGKRLNEVTRWLVQKYKHERLQTMIHGRSLAPATVNRELSTLRRIFNLAIEWGQAVENPAARFKALPEPPRQEHIFTPEEIQRLLGAASPHLRDIILLALNTGMRRGEILTLTWDQIEWDRRTLLLTHTKNGRARRVPLNPVALEVLRREPRTGPYVFGGDHPPKSVRTAFHAAIQRAGLRPCWFHDLRHMAATYMIHGGADLATVKEILGHSHISLTLRYAHPTSDSRLRAVASLATLTRASDGHQGDTTATIPLATTRVSALQ